MCVVLMSSVAGESACLLGSVGGFFHLEVLLLGQACHAYGHAVLGFVERNEVRWRDLLVSRVYGGTVAAFAALHVVGPNERHVRLPGEEHLEIKTITGVRPVSIFIGKVIWKA